MKHVEYGPFKVRDGLDLQCLTPEIQKSMEAKTYF